MLKFCQQCGKPANYSIPPGEDRPRLICASCKYIYYENPRIVSACIPEYDGKVLLARRAIQPRLGLWTFPSGFLEIGESPEEGAAREALEECCCEVRIDSLLGVFSILHVGHIYMVFRATLQKPEFAPGDESLECSLFEAHEIPWDSIAFSAVKEALSYWCEIRGLKNYPVKHSSFQPKTF